MFSTEQELCVNPQAAERQGTKLESEPEVHHRHCIGPPTVCVQSRSMDDTGNYARILFVDFCSAFNTIIPHILERQLSLLQVPTSTCRWITDFLTNRAQRAKPALAPDAPTLAPCRAASCLQPCFHCTPTAAPLCIHRSSSSLQTTPPWWASYPGGTSLEVQEGDRVQL